MASIQSRNELRKVRQDRGRRKIKGTAERPRICVYKSLKALYVQVIDDEAGHTLIGLTTGAGELKDGLESPTNLAAAEKLGEAVGAKLIERGITAVVFDRSGYKFHGAVKAIADAARKAGAQF